MRDPYDGAREIAQNNKGLGPAVCSTCILLYVLSCIFSISLPACFPKFYISDYLIGDMRNDPEPTRLQSGFVQLQPKLFRLKASYGPFLTGQRQVSSVWLIECTLQAINQTLKSPEDTLKLVIGRREICGFACHLLVPCVLFSAVLLQAPADRMTSVCAL